MTIVRTRTDDEIRASIRETRHISRQDIQDTLSECATLSDAKQAVFTLLEPISIEELGYGGKTKTEILSRIYDDLHSYKEFSV